MAEQACAIEKKDTNSAMLALNIFSYKFIDQIQSFNLNPHVPCLSKQLLGVRYQIDMSRLICHD